MADELGKTYTIEPYGKKFATVCRTDGYWSITWLSKNTKLARRKGEEFISGKRTELRVYRTGYGKRIDDDLEFGLRIGFYGRRWR